MCDHCLAMSTAGPLHYADFRDEAGWTETVQTLSSFDKSNMRQAPLGIQFHSVRDSVAHFA